MGSSWGDVLHNAIKEVKGAPAGLLKTGEAVAKDVTAPYNLILHPSWKNAAKLEYPSNTFNDVLKPMFSQYKAIGEHPIRQFQKGPIGTTLAVLPLAGAAGRAADVGAEAGATRLLEPSAPGRAAATSRLLHGPMTSNVPGARALKAAGVLAKDAGPRITGTRKYEPDTNAEFPRKPFAGSVPGLKFDQGKLGQLHSDLGNLNITHGGDYGPANDPGLQGSYYLRSQSAHTFLHPQHLDTKMSDAQANDMLTSTTLHEARHGWQQANWSRPKRFVDTYRSYSGSKRETDANRFAQENLAKYQGLTTRDPLNPRLPAHMQPHGSDPMQTLDNMIAHHAMGEQGVTPEMILNHAEALVKAGLLDPQEAMDLESHYGAYSKRQPVAPPPHTPLPNTRGMTMAQKVRAALPGNHPALKAMDTIGRGNYTPPASQQDLFNRAALKARAK